MIIFRNQYVDGTNGWFPTEYDAKNNANAFHPASLRIKTQRFVIDSKNDLIRTLKSLEDEKKPTP